MPGKANFSEAAYRGYYSPQYLFTAGYKFFISNDIFAMPSAMVQVVQPFPMQLHMNAKVLYRDLLWVGASYRISDELGGYAAMAGINISNTFNIGYSYDAATTSSLRKYARNTNEIVIGFLLNNKEGDNCPRNNW